jgi:hypothetical protein
MAIVLFYITQKRIINKNCIFFRIYYSKKECEGSSNETCSRYCLQMQPVAGDRVAVQPQDGAIWCISGMPVSTTVILKWPPLLMQNSPRTGSI